MNGRAELNNGRKLRALSPTRPSWSMPNSTSSARNVPTSMFEGDSGSSRQMLAEYVYPTASGGAGEPSLITEGAVEESAAVESSTMAARPLAKAKVERVAQLGVRHDGTVDGAINKQREHERDEQVQQSAQREPHARARQRRQ
eukprot:scaffold125023_cov33-Tisochrysis_lutea.AAC.2